jgi:hypothetical protein
MKDWLSVARGYGLRIPEKDLRAAVEAMERLEADFRPLVDRIPLQTEPAYVALRFREEPE